MPSEFAGVRNALLALAEASDRVWRGNETAQQRLTAGIRLEKDVLAKLLEDPTEICVPPPGKEHLYFLLPPTVGASEMLSLLSIKWSFPEETERRRGAIKLFLIPPRTAAVADKIEPFMFRFDDWEETAEACFSHIQVCDSVTPYDRFFAVPADRWLPATIPRLPLGAEASSPEAVLVACVVSLYGVESSVFSRVVAEVFHSAAKDLARRVALGRPGG